MDFYLAMELVFGGGQARASLVSPSLFPMSVFNKKKDSNSSLQEYSGAHNFIKYPCTWRCGPTMSTGSNVEALHCTCQHEFDSNISRNEYCRYSIYDSNCLRQKEAANAATRTHYAVHGAAPPELRSSEPVRTLTLQAIL